MESSLKLDYGEIICDKCNGEGYIGIQSETEMIALESNGIITKIPGQMKFEYVICPKCIGTKKVNWIENIFGKQQERNWQEVLDDLIENNLMKEYLKRVKGCW